MEVKVCGLTSPSQMRQLHPLVHRLGMIFHPSSPRNALQVPPEQVRPLAAKVVAVTVNLPLAALLDIAASYGIAVFQLHGDEPPSLCRELSGCGFEVWKAFGIASASDLRRVIDYEGTCSRAVLDFKSDARGGAGRKFDWSLLAGYPSNLPFMLAGGISPEDAAAIRAIEAPMMGGVDLNSRFETAPGVKDVALIEKFIKILENE